MYRVAIRADGGAGIGMGHIMRCLTLAKEFTRSGCSVVFISKNEEGIDKIREEGFAILKLHGFTLLEEAGAIAEIARLQDLDLLFVDSYNVAEEYFLMIKPYVKKLGYIDDLNSLIYPVDILLNGSVLARYMDYKSYSSSEMLLLGLEYNLLRGEFENVPVRVINKDVKELMITTGGSDPYNMSPYIINMLLSDEGLKALRLNVIVGSAFRNKELLQEIAVKNSNVELYENPKYISDIMLKSDIAISSGGGTLYELCACGTPVLGYIMADNQQSVVEKMSQLGLIESLGWYNKFTSVELTGKLKKLCDSYETRTALNHKMKQLVDGKGAERAVREILEGRLAIRKG